MIAETKSPAGPAKLRHDLDLSRERMARLVDVSAKTVERWEERDGLPDRASYRVISQFAQLREIRDLGLIVLTPAGFRLFLRSSLPALGGRTPLQAIEQGDGDRVLGILAGLYEGLGG